MSRSKLNILIVEDSQDEITLQEVVLRRTGVTDPVVFIQGGHEASQYLQKRNVTSSKQNQAPTLLLLDLNMPGMNGLDLLRWLRENPMLFLLGKVVVTSSSDEQQIAEAYALGAAGVFRKPNNIEQMASLFRRIYEYWSVAEDACAKLEKPQI